MLRSLLAVVSLLLPVAPAFGQAAPAANPIAQANYRVLYLEVAPADVNRVASSLKDYRQAAMKAGGALRIDVLQQMGRPNHFAVYESWRDNAALEAHKNAAETRKLEDMLQATRVSPVDERLLSVIGPPSATTGAAGAIYVVTHADSVPPSRDAAQTALTDLAIRSRQEP
ncbi:MAG TPA: antibiotic biosynthesis monooxygenase family protein, partial [Vicinamibacterales bacterium]